jgi:hypothetical protein
MKKLRLGLSVLCTALLTMSGAAYAAITPYNMTFTHVANDSGTKYDTDEVNLGAPDETYYFAFTKDGKGFDSIHLTTDLAVTNGQLTTLNTTTSSTAGTFYITDTGGRGHGDDILLMLSSSGTIADDFQVNIKSSGYSFTPGNTSYDAVYVNNALNETFTKADFIYGPQSYRLSSLANYPFYYGQDPATNSFFMLVDLYVGTLSGSEGAITVSYELSGLDNQTLSFNAYSWCGVSNSGEGVYWTNPTSNSYMINSAPAPVPVPPALLLFGSGLAGIAAMRRRKTEVG